MTKKYFGLFVIPIVPILSQSLNFQFLAQKFKDLANREVTTGREAKIWWDEYWQAVTSYNEAIHWRGTIQGAEYQTEALQWKSKCEKKQGDIEDMILEYETKSLDPYSRTMFRIIGKQFTKPERLGFKIGAVGITVATGGAAAPTVIKSFAPDIAHEIAQTLQEEQILTQKEKTGIDLYIDIGSLAWSLKDVLTAPDKTKLIAEASKFGLKITNFCIIGNKCNFTVQRGNITQSVVMEFEGLATSGDYDFSITYPSENTSNWDKSVRGRCSPAYQGCKVKVYIKTDKNYLQGEAEVDEDGRWSIDQTWPTKGTANTIFAELYDSIGKKVATSNKVVLFP